MNYVRLSENAPCPLCGAECVTDDGWYIEHACGRWDNRQELRVSPQCPEAEGMVRRYTAVVRAAEKWLARLNDVLAINRRRSELRDEVAADVDVAYLKAAGQSYSAAMHELGYWVDALNKTIDEEDTHGPT